MIKQNLIMFALLTLYLTSVKAQETVNQLDVEGQRHGFWKKNFEKTKQPRYEGTFEHGKEVGTFKYYTLNKGKSVLSATREFSKEHDTINVAFFSSKGKVISEGQMIGKNFIGKWVYYHNKTNGVMTVENYNSQGLLQGEKFVYYENGQIAEQSNYNNGKIDGISKWFSKEGVVLKEFTYKNDELHGISKYYNAEGQLLAEGAYKNDQKHGIWKYYENGILKEEKNFTLQSKNPKKQ